MSTFDDQVDDEESLQNLQRDAERTREFLIRTGRDLSDEKKDLEVLRNQYEQGLRELKDLRGSQVVLLSEFELRKKEVEKTAERIENAKAVIERLESQAKAAREGLFVLDASIVLAKKKLEKYGKVLVFPR